MSLRTRPGTRINIKFESIKRIICIASMKLESPMPAQSAPLVFNPQHYHWYAATNSPFREVAIVKLNSACQLSPRKYTDLSPTLLGTSSLV